MRDGQTSVADIISAIAGSIVLAAVALVGVIRIAGDARALGPVPGDIVAFVAGAPVHQKVLRVVASIAPGTVLCLLEAKEMAGTGGSLIVEARDGDDYHVHWAGARTSGGSADCGQARDLVVSRADLASLAVAAGGFGAITTTPIPRLHLAEAVNALP